MTAAELNLVERTLFLIKPKGMEYEEEILDHLRTIGSLVAYHSYDTSPMDKVQQHYNRIRASAPHIYIWMIEGFKEKPMASGIIEGTDAIDQLIRITGDTDPYQAAEGTIRSLAYQYNKETLARSIEETRMCDNFIHRSRRDAFVFERGVWHPEIV